MLPQTALEAEVVPLQMASEAAAAALLHLASAAVEAALQQPAWVEVEAAAMPPREATWAAQEVQGSQSSAMLWPPCRPCC